MDKNERVAEHEELLGTIVERLDEGYSSSNRLGTAIPCGFDEIDSICSGFIPGESLLFNL